MNISQNLASAWAGFQSSLSTTSNIGLGFTGLADKATAELSKNTQNPEMAKYWGDLASQYRQVALQIQNSAQQIGFQALSLGQENIKSTAQMFLRA
jgi:hypothetical protein